MGKKLMVLLAGAVLFLSAACASVGGFDAQAVVQGKVLKSQSGKCGPIVVVKGLIDVGGEEVVVYLSENGLLLIIRFDDQDQPKEVLVGVVSKDKKVKITETLTIDQAQAKYPNPCAYLGMKGA